MKNILKKAAELKGVVPSTLYLQAVKRTGSSPFSGGGFSDVWMGELDGISVGLKVMRFFEGTDDLDSKYKVRITSVIDRNYDTYSHHKILCKEAIVWRDLIHPNILPFLGICKNVFGPLLALVSPYMENGDVLSYVKQNRDTKLSMVR